MLSSKNGGEKAAGAPVISPMSFGAAVEGQKAQEQSDGPAWGLGSPHSSQEAEICSGIQDGAESGQGSQHLASLASCKDKRGL